MAKKESFLSKLRGESSNLNEEQELRKELLNLKISLSSGQLKETHKIKEIKRSIAQLKTIQKETLKEQNKDG
jgi:ribosomal protein L29